MNGTNDLVQGAAARLPPGLTIVEQINRPIATCDNPRVPVVLGMNHETRVAVIWRPRCKLWSCEACAQINAACWSIIAQTGVEAFLAEGRSPCFFTITSHERLSAAATMRVWPRAWAKLSTRLRRKIPGIQYLMVPEKHEDGRLHVHGVASDGIPERWLKDNARECGLGYQAATGEIENPRRVASYVTKYLVKQLESTDWPKHFRRVRTSRGWPKPEPVTDTGSWHWVVLTSQDSEEIEAEVLRREGYLVIVGDHRTAWARLKAQQPLHMLNFAMQGLDKTLNFDYAIGASVAPDAAQNTCNQKGLFDGK